MVEKKSYTTRELAQMWNVSESTVKRWADIGELKCFRTAGGHRRFTLDHISEFQTSKGFEGTGILLDQDWELPELDTCLNQKKSDKIQEALIFLASHNQSSRIRQLLERIYIRGVDLAELYDEIILPAAQSLELSRRSGQTSFGKHRLAATNLEAGLYYFFPKIIRRRPNGNTALCAGADDASSLLVTAVARILEVEGWESLNLGDGTPFAAMAEMVDQEPINLVCVNMSCAKHCEEAARLFPILNHAADNYRIPIVLTGPGFADPEVRRLFQHTEYFASLQVFRQYVSRFTG